MSLCSLSGKARSPWLRLGLLALLSLGACRHAAPVPQPTPAAAATAPAPAAAAPLSFGDPDPAPAGFSEPSSPLPAERFPSLIGGLPLLDAIDYEARGHAGLGYSLSYGSRESVLVTVYVYDMGQSPIPAGSESAQVREQLRKATADIYQAEQMGLYLNVSRLREADAVIGSSEPGKGLRAHGAVFRFEVQKEPKTSHVYASAYRGSFVKIRCTYANSPETEPQSEAALQRFLVALWPVLNS